MDMDPPYPTSIDDVIALIHRLYQSGDPQQLAAIQAVLQKAQRSPEGWQLADSLLENSDQNVQFFGALTFTVKLNSDWQTLPEPDVVVLRNRLLNWLVRLVASNATQLVVKKLCSTLVVFFVRYPDSFPHPIKHLLCCMYTESARSLEEFGETVDTVKMLRELSAPRKLALAWFSSTLAEEVGKIEVRNSKSHSYHVAVHDESEHIVQLIQTMISENADPKLIETGLQSFQAWVFYGLRVSLEAEVDYAHFKPLTQSVINCLASDDHFDIACDVIIDILAQSYAFLTPEDSASLAVILISPWGMERYKSFVSGDGDSEAEQFGRLLVTYAEATVQNLIVCLDTERGRTIIDMMHGLLTVPGYPNVDDEISTTTFEFWGSFVDYILDNDDGENWVVLAVQEVQRAVEEFWRKIRIPTGSEPLRWRTDQKDGFMAYRRDVADFVEAAYAVVGTRLFKQFVDQVVSSITGKSPEEVPWHDVEASLYCLNSLSDSLGDEPVEDQCIEVIFGSPLFGLLSQIGDVIPIKARTSGVTIIGSYAAFFERHPEHLPPALNFLFTCLSTPQLTASCSKSISSLCSSCRKSLTSEISAFLHQYKLFASQAGADDTAKERVLCAISYVIQALPSDSTKLEPIAALLSFVEGDAQNAVDLAFRGALEPAREVAQAALRSLVAVGKGLQSPEDVPIDISSSDDIEPPNSKSQRFWENGPGAPIQSRLLALLRLLCSTFPHDGEIVDTVCAVFKTGFCETVPGLFCFPPDIITEFLLSHSWRTEKILATACTFIGSYAIDKKFDIRPHVLSLLQFVDSLTTQLGEPQNDPDIAQSVVEFLHKMVRCYPDVLVLYQPVQSMEKLFLFTLNSLMVREPLLKKSATSFWTSVLSVSEQEQHVQAAIDGIVVGCGAALAEKLTSAIAGGCQRSEVDAFSEPLRKLVVRHVKAKAWLQAALDANTNLGPHIVTQDKRLFVEKVISLRGKRTTNQVAKDFWLKCRGTEFAYVS